MSQSQSYRQSIDPSTLSPSQQLLLQKQQEYLGLVALRDASTQLVARIDKLGEMSNVMADGGEAIGQVMRNWPHVFSVLNLLEKPAASTANSANASAPADDADTQEPLPQLVRLQYTGEPNAQGKNGV